MILADHMSIKYEIHSIKNSQGTGIVERIGIVLKDRM